MPKIALFLILIAGASWIAPLYGQDDNGPVTQPQPQVYNQAPAVQDDGAPVPDDANAAPTDVVTFQTFYDALASMGTWIQSNDYGYVWQPQVNDPDWAPYTVGHWVYSDDGWTWVSDEPWGWATYHYGRWVNLDGIGWCWVPGYTWAPAWVSWRYGDGYAGWAPLPPDSFVGVDYSDDGSDITSTFHIGGDCDGFYGIGAGWYNFVPVTCLGYRNYHGYYCHRGDNYAIINRTTNVTNINVATAGTNDAAFGRVSAGGPMLEQVNAASSTPVAQVSLAHAHHAGGGGTLTGNSVAFYAPRVSSESTAAPQNVEGSISRSTINRGTDVRRPLAVNSRLEGASPTEAQLDNARIAENHVPAGAKVMTENMQVTPMLQAPLATLKPAARQEAPRSYGTSPGVYSHDEPSNVQVVPTVRAYPQSAYPEPQQREPTQIYYSSPVYPQQSSSFAPHAPTQQPGVVPENRIYERPASPTPSGTGENRTYVHPSTPTPSAPSPSETQPHASGSYPGGGGSYHEQSNGGQSGGTHASGTGGRSSQSH